jgi:N-acetylmuramoyl-L-alanine amidase
MNYSLQAIKIMLEGAPSNYHVKYRAHVRNIGWQAWVTDGVQAGTTGQNLPIEALEVIVYVE